MTAPMLETRGLGRAFGALQAVADVSLAVEPGELRAVIGPNGERTIARQSTSESTTQAAARK